MYFRILWLALLVMSCTAEWSPEDKSRILKDCHLSSQKFGIQDKDKHCQCVLDKIMARYPNHNQFENMEMGEFGAIVWECQGREAGAREIWPQKTQRAFLDSCEAMAIKKGKKEAPVYCSCVLQQLMEHFPTNDDLSQLNPEIMKKISNDCEK